jgi:aryl-alcohol dehydrogenase-like predicted oxidoreductase
MAPGLGIDMNTTPSTFTIAADTSAPIAINRMGFGAMRITGPGIWGNPADRCVAVAVLKRAVELGINFIDTADSYGPEISEDLIREALHPYDSITIATKGGLTRQGPDQWAPVGRPEYLRQAVHLSLRRLGVDQIDLWQLHRIDPQVPRDEQFECIAQMQQEGLIAHMGLSEVNVEEVQAAQQYFNVVTVQNLYNVGNRQSEELLNYCDTNAIGFIPWFPLGNRELVSTDGPLAAIAKANGCTPSQVALAWLLQRSPVVIPIPGTGSLDHLEENYATINVTLTPESISELNQLS